MDYSEIHRTFEERKKNHGIEFQAKKEQLEIALSVVNKRHVLGMLPTGFGKTLCMLIPSILFDISKITVVVSPLLALMDDQMDKISRMKITVAKLQPLDEMNETVIEHIKKGMFQVVIGSPETLLKTYWKDIFLSPIWQERVQLIAVDEAHCISEWGGDFRKEYRMIHELRSIFNCPVMALTATTTETVKNDILKYLQLSDVHTDIVALKPDRPNIFIDIQLTSGRQYIDSLNWLIANLKEKKRDAKKTIVYCRSVNTVAEIFLLMKEELGVDAYVDKEKDSEHLMVEMYHKSTHTDSKNRIINTFKRPDSNIRCVIATIALGMGLDIPDIDIVVHVGSPKSVLSYWQEMGRCARDGRKGYALTLYDNLTLSQKNTDTEIAEILRNAGNACFRKMILNKFVGVEPETVPETKCGNCTEQDICSCTQCICCCSCIKRCSCQSKIEFGIQKFLKL